MAGILGEWEQPQARQAMPYVQLQVQEIERLANAGVKIELGPIVPTSDIAPAHPTPPKHPYEHMADAIWERWTQSRRASGNFHGLNGTMRPFQLMASQHGDKVWVSVHPNNFNYEPFQLQDEAVIFPSDALMATLALWEKNHPTGGNP
jgi:hypothetical protein